MNESLPHAIQRMRAQGYDDKHIAGQIHHWHKTWTPDQVKAAIGPAPKASPPPRHGGPERFDPPSHSGNFRTANIGLNPALYDDPNVKVPSLGAAWLNAGDAVAGLGVGIRPSTMKRFASHPLRFAAKNRKDFKASGYRDAEMSPTGVALFGATYGSGAARRIAARGAEKGLATSFTAGGARKGKNIAALRAEFTDLETKYNEFLDGFLNKKLTPDELKRQREDINPMRGKYKKQNSGKTKSGKASGASGWKVQQLPMNVKEENRLQMEQELHRLAAAHPNDTGAQAFLAAHTRMEELRSLIHAHEEESLGALPVKAENIKRPVKAVPDEQLTVADELVSPEPFDVPAPPAPVAPRPPLAPVPSRAYSPDDAAQLRAVLSGKAAKDALKSMGSWEKAGAKADPIFGMSAKRAYKAEEKLRTEERIVRLKKANDILANKALEPAERIALWKDEMRGELPKINWRGFEELDGDAVRAMTRYAMDEAPHFLGTQRVQVVEALENAVKGVVPRPHEIKLLERMFGKDAAPGLTKLAGHPLRELIIGVLNIPRTLMASIDFSAPLRQGLVIGTRHPVVAAKNFPAMFKAFGRPGTRRGEEYFQGIGAEIMARPTYPLMLEAKLPLTGLDHGVAQSEEAFMGANVAEKITGGKRFSPVRMSDRAYTGYLDKLRADVFDLLIRQAEAGGKNVHDPKFLKDLGRFIGNATGRGTFNSEALEKAMPLLNIGLFSPRLIASRVAMINPLYYRSERFGGLDPFVRRQALTSAISTFGTILTVLGLAKMAGAKVEDDWRSSDFGKIKMGDTRLDIAGGFQQYFHLLGEILTGERKSTSTGETTSLRHPKFGQKSTLDVLVGFGRGKLAPVPSMFADTMAGSNAIGEKTTITKEMKSHFIPLIWQDVHDLYKHPVMGMNGVEAALLGYAIGGFGTGLQTYKTKAPSLPAGAATDPFDRPGGGGGEDPFSSGGGGSDPFQR